MTDEFNLTPGESELERQLGALAPNPSRVDERTIWFEAGRRRGRRTARVWASVAPACVLMTIGTLTWRSTPTPEIARQSDPAPRGVVTLTTAPNRVFARDQSRAPIDLTHLPGWSEPTTPRGRGVLSQPALHPGDLSDVGLADL